MADAERKAPLLAEAVGQVGVDVDEEEGDEPLLVDAPPPREATLASSTFALTTSAIGAGVLSLPYSLRCTGWLAGCASLCAFALGSYWSLALIEFRALDLGCDSYEGVGAALYGPRMGVFIEVVMFLLLFLAEITFLVLLGDMLPTLCARALGVPEGDGVCARRPALGLALLLATGPSLLRRLHALRHVSVAALGCLGYLLLVVAAEAWVASGEGALATDVTPVHTPGRSWLYMLPVQAAAYCNQFNFVAVMNELREPTPPRLAAVRALSVGSCLCVYLLYASLGYLLFGEGVQGDLLRSLEGMRAGRRSLEGAAEGGGGDGGALALALLVGKAALCACLLLKVPLLLQPLRAIASGWLRRLCGCGCAACVPPPLPRSPPGASPGSGAGGRRRGCCGRKCTTAHARHEAAHVLETLVLLLLLYLAAALLARVEIVFNVGGALGLAIITFVLPGAFAFRPPFSTARRASARQRAQGAALIAVGVLVTASSVFVVVADTLSAARAHGAG